LDLESFALAEIIFEDQDHRQCVLQLLTV